MTATYLSLDDLIKNECEGIMTIDESPAPKSQPAGNTMAAVGFDLRIKKSLFKKTVNASQSIIFILDRSHSMVVKGRYDRLAISRKFCIKVAS